jgi:hypothetical protein
MTWFTTSHKTDATHTRHRVILPARLVEGAMSDAAEFRQNALLCADIAEGTHKPLDPEIWHRMQRGWLDLAAKADISETQQALGTLRP